MQTLLVANWKMNLARAESVALSGKLRTFVEESGILSQGVTLAIVPSAAILGDVGGQIGACGIKLAGQDCSIHEAGAYTGEISAKTLKEYGCDYVILGHSERRKYHMETSETVAAKAEMAYKNGITPIICIGESEDDRKQGIAVDSLTKQLLASLPPSSSSRSVDPRQQTSSPNGEISNNKYPFVELFIPGSPQSEDDDSGRQNIPAHKKLIIAYEPIWSIGTGKLPELSQIHEVVEVIRNTVKGEVTILYGGSVSPDNCESILKIPGLGGLLIGGASIVYDQLTSISRSAFKENII